MQNVAWANDLAFVKKLFNIVYKRHKIQHACSRVRIAVSVLYILSFTTAGHSLSYLSTLLRTKHREIQFNEMQLMSGPVFYNLELLGVGTSYHIS